MTGLKTHITPLDPNIQLSKDQCSSTDEEKVAMSKISYREAIGSLMWAAVATRPDIALQYHYYHNFSKIQERLIGKWSRES